MWARIEALLRNRAVVADYVTARDRWRQGEPTLFPPGTYWLRRFAYVPVAEPQSSYCCSRSDRNSSTRDVLK